MRSLLAALTLLLACAPTGPAARGEARDGAAACHTDLECSPGDECIRPRGELNGVCGRLVDGRANPTTGIRRQADPCRNDFDCPPQFRCELTTASVGVCVKP